MNRLSPLLPALGLMACLLAAPALTPPASAGVAGLAGVARNAASEHSRTYRYVERYAGFGGEEPGCDLRLPTALG